MEFELGRVRQCATGAQARARVAAWIEECNAARRHRACAMERPVAWALAGRGQEAA